MNIVILAGGIGTRLWPLGRKHNPKQFFPMISKKPLVRETYDRFVGHYGKKKVFLSVTADLFPHLKKLFPGLLAGQFIVEPSRRDTAPAMGYAAAVLSLRHPDEPMVFVPADHFIADTEKYLRCFAVGEKLVRQTGKLLDIGITATFPSTVLGYTKIGRRYDTVGGVEVFHFLGHTEKPTASVATRYVTSGQYLWHGNYYMWTPESFLGAIQRYHPALGQGIARIQEALRSQRLAEARAWYEALDKISFDYAVTEKINKKEVLIIKGDFGWGDIGAWDVLHHQLRATGGDQQGNVIKGQVIYVDTANCLLYAHPKRMVAAIGLSDTIIVDTDDAVLVCPKERAQDVKKLFPEIEKRGLKKYL